MRPDIHHANAMVATMPPILEIPTVTRRLLVEERKEEFMARNTAKWPWWSRK
jgi:hypothetical protein